MGGSCPTLGVSRSLRTTSSLPQLQLESTEPGSVLCSCTPAVVPHHALHVDVVADVAEENRPRPDTKLLLSAFIKA